MNCRRYYEPTSRTYTETAADYRRELIPIPRGYYAYLWDGKRVQRPDNRRTEADTERDNTPDSEYLYYIIKNYIEKHGLRVIYSNGVFGWLESLKPPKK